MNKLSTILLSSLFLAQLTACGDDGGDDTGGSSTGTGTDTGTATSTSTSAGTTTTTSAGTTSSTTAEDDTTSTSGDTEDDTGTGGETDTDTDSAGETAVVDTDTDTAGNDTDSGGDAPAMCMETCEEDEDCYQNDADAGLLCIEGQCLTPPCEEDADCLSGGIDVGLTCVEGACIPACEETLECQTNGWQPCGDTCTTACIAVGDEELCAGMLDTEELPCSMFSQIAEELTTVDDETVTACVFAMVCRDFDGTMMCSPPLCNEEGGSCPDDTWTCNEETGACFQCTEDSDCEDDQVCYEGRCHTPCEDPAEDCQQWYDGTELSCE